MISSIDKLTGLETECVLRLELQRTTSWNRYESNRSGSGMTVGRGCIYNL